MKNDSLTDTNHDLGTSVFTGVFAAVATPAAVAVAGFGVGFFMDLVRASEHLPYLNQAESLAFWGTIVAASAMGGANALDINHHDAEQRTFSKSVVITSAAIVLKLSL